MKEANTLRKGRSLRRLFTLAALALVSAAMVGGFFSSQATTPAAAASGDNLDTFDAAVTAGIPACSSGIGTGIAYDGDSLILSCWGSNVLERVDAVTHLNNGAVTISGLPLGNDIRAMAWDAGRQRLWACDGTSAVVLIDVGAAAVDVSQPSIPVAGCVDGLAYDGTDDTLWASCDACPSVEHYDIPGGGLIDSFPTGGLIGACGNSGIAVGGSKLYLANNGCSEIYQVEKDFSSSSFFANFLPFRLEDLECDSSTFAPLGAIWSQDAYDRVLNAWELPAEPGLECTSGGGAVDTGKNPQFQNLWLCADESVFSDNCNSADIDYIINPAVTTADPKCVGFPNFLPDAECDRQDVGAWEFEIRFDAKYIDVQLEAGYPLIPGTDVCQTYKGQGVVQIVCNTKRKDLPLNGISRLAVAHITPTSDTYSLLMANQDNGIVTQLINQDCNLSDTQGHPIPLDGGHDWCANDGAITIRYLEGDVHADCVIDIHDQQQIAFRWGSHLGQLLYNSRFDLEPSSPKLGDGDIDGKDIQTVFGRHDSDCKAPHPEQPPIDPMSKEGEPPLPTSTSTPTPTPTPLI